MRTTGGGRPLIMVVLALLLLALCTLTLVLGPVNVSVSQVFDSIVKPGSDEAVSRIVWGLRIPRMAAALLAGVALSVSGLALQTVFRNPLCGPFVLGISSGASLGVAVAMLAGFGFGCLGVLGSATVGALVVTLAVMWLASRFERNSVLLVAGLLIGYFIDALVSVLVAQSDAESLRVYVAWGMGSFGRLVLDDIWLFFGAVVVGLAFVVCSMRYLNTALMGDDFARGLGVPVRCSKRFVLLGSSLLAAACTAFCGPVAFVGIATPHLAFMLFKTTNCRVLVPGAALCGANLCLVAGLFPVSIPLNALLSVVGVPIILFVISRSAGRGNL